MNAVGFQCDGCYKYEIINSTSGYCHLSPRSAEIHDNKPTVYNHPIVPNNDWCFYWTTDKRVQ